MAIPSRQIGWGTEDNLLWQISKQLEQLTNVTAKACANNAPTYKVYTALLTQSGGDNSQLGSAFPLTIGVTYFIDDNVGGADFTNVGAPNNNIGTYFIATGTTPTSWGDGTLIYNTGAPVVTVLENTIGNITWMYNNIGDYTCDLGNAFPINKTIYDKNYQFISPTDIDDEALVFYSNLNVFNIFTSSYDLTIPKDDVLLNTPIEIRVYS